MEATAASVVALTLRFILPPCTPPWKTAGGTQRRSKISFGLGNLAVYQHIPHNTAAHGGCRGAPVLHTDVSVTLDVKEDRHIPKKAKENSPDAEISRSTVPRAGRWDRNLRREENCMRRHVFSYWYKLRPDTLFGTARLEL